MAELFVAPFVDFLPEDLRRPRLGVLGGDDGCVADLEACCLAEGGETSTTELGESMVGECRLGIDPLDDRVGDATSSDPSMWTVSLAGEAGSSS
jgi:hypothetical protein